MTLTRVIAWDVVQRKHTAAQFTWAIWRIGVNYHMQCIFVHIIHFEDKLLIVLWLTGVKGGTGAVCFVHGGQLHIRAWSIASAVQ